MHEAERKELLEKAKAQPVNRVKLADKATRTGRAYVKDNPQEADKWFALSAEIRGKATDVVVSSKPVVEISHEEVALEESKQQRRGDPAPLHYKKVEGKITTITSLVESGNGIRKTSRDTGVAVNTVRKLVREGKASDQLKLGLDLLRDDVIKSFTQAIDKTREQYNLSKYGDSEYDVYMETLIERNDLESITKMLKHWVKYLDALPDCQHTRGAKLALLSIAELCSTIGKMMPPE